MTKWNKKIYNYILNENKIMYWFRLTFLPYILGIIFYFILMIIGNYFFHKDFQQLSFFNFLCKIFSISILSIIDAKISYTFYKGIINNKLYTNKNIDTFSYKMFYGCEVAYIAVLAIDFLAVSLRYVVTLVVVFVLCSLLFQKSLIKNKSKTVEQFIKEVKGQVINNG